MPRPALRVMLVPNDQGRNSSHQHSGDHDASVLFTAEHEGLNDLDVLW